MKLTNNIPVIIWGKAKITRNDQNGVLVTSPSAFQHAKNIITGLSDCQIILIQSSEKDYVEKLVTSKPPTARVAYLVGGGQVMDIGRYLASKWKLEAICIPTIISTDAFLVDCTGLRRNGCVSYVESKRADRVILDWQLLKASPWRFHMSGCGDVLSIFTALYDWQYANKQQRAIADERYNRSVAIMAEAILEGLISSSKEISTKSKKGLAVIVTALAMEVQLCNFYGNSRPEEGGEHYFTYCIENRMPHFLHGEMVAFGTLLTGYLQGQDIINIKNFMDEVGLNYKPKGLKRTTVVETLEELPSYVRKHNLRFSSYNDFDYFKYNIKINEFFKLIDL